VIEKIEHYEWQTYFFGLEKKSIRPFLEKNHHEN